MHLYLIFHLFVFVMCENRNFDDIWAAMVAVYPAIWDKRSNDYRDENKKENAIKAIANVINCSDK